MRTGPVCVCFRRNAVSRSREQPAANGPYQSCNEQPEKHGFNVNASARSVAVKSARNDGHSDRSKDRA